MAELLAANEPLVLFAYHKDVASALAARFRTALTLAAKDSSKKRAETTARFQRGESQLLICALMATGVGITLTRAAHLAFAEATWHAATHLQAEDRIHRIGQTRPVSIHYLLSENTIDERVVNVISRKWSLATHLGADVLGQIEDEFLRG